MTFWAEEHPAKGMKQEEVCGGPCPDVETFQGSLSLHPLVGVGVGMGTECKQSPTCVQIALHKSFSYPLLLLSSLVEWVEHYHPNYKDNDKSYHLLNIFKVCHYT